MVILSLSIYICKFTYIHTYARVFLRPSLPSSVAPSFLLFFSSFLCIAKEAKEIHGALHL